MNDTPCGYVRLTTDYTIVRERRLEQERDFERSLATTCNKN
jgi:hypothetical protein